MMKGSITDWVLVMNDFSRGFFWVLVSVLSGTMMYILAKDLLATQTQADCCYWWFGFAFVFYILYYLLSGTPFKTKIIKRYVLWIILFVVLQTASTILFFAGLKMIDPSLSSFLQRSQVVFTIILGMVILGERFQKGEWVPSLIIITGLFMITFRIGRISFIGSSLMLGSTFFGSFSSIVIRKIGCHIGAHTFAFIRTSTLLIFYVLYAFSVPGAFTLLPVGTLIRVCLGSFLGPFLTVISSYKALEYMDAGKVALLGSLQPFFIVISAFLIFGTIPALKGIIGGVLMVVGNIVFIRMNMKKHKVPIAPNIPYVE